MRRLKGFTLTELMVAMAVIGILIAVVTPAIMKTRPNKNKMMIKKSFYTTEQIISTLINDEKLYPDMRDVCEANEPSADATNIYCAWGFDYDNSVTYEGETYNGATKFADLFASRLNVKTSDDTNHVYTTTDGIKWDLSGAATAWTKSAGTPGTFAAHGEGTAGMKTILIDVNGDEAPNCRQSGEGCSEDNFDQYQIEILATGKLRIAPADAKAVEYATINTSIRDNMN